MFTEINNWLKNIFSNEKDLNHDVRQKSLTELSYNDIYRDTNQELNNMILNIITLIVNINKIINSFIYLINIYLKKF